MSEAATYAGGVAFMVLCTLSNASGLLMQRLAHRSHSERHAAAADGGAAAPHSAEGDGTLLAGGPRSAAAIKPSLSQRLHDRGFFCANPWWIAGFSFQIVGGLSAVGGLALIGQARCAAFAGACAVRRGCVRDARTIAAIVLPPRPTCPPTPRVGPPQA